MKNFLKGTEAGPSSQGQPESEPAESLETPQETVFMRTPAEQIQHFIDGGFEEEAMIYEKVAAFAEAIKEVGGQAVMVGGSVRDEIMGMPCKDYDIEVYGVEPQALLDLTQAFGSVKEVGASFGVLKLQLDGFDIDVSLPRRESSTGAGHKDFSVSADPHMSIEEASKRRDFTINAVGKDVLTGEVYDYFGGLEDIKRRTLRVVDEEMFKEDPLRVLRGVQFVARFGLFVEDETMRIMRETRDSMKHLPKERFEEEWKKLLLRSRKPSLGLNAAMEIGIFHTIHPYVSEMPITPQEEDWHPEGDVWTHTLWVVDEAAKIVEQEQIEGDDALEIMLAAFCHDLAKPQKTKIVDGKVISHGHEEAGVEPTEKFLYEIGVPGKMRKKVKELVAMHLMPPQLYRDEERGQKIKDKTFRKLHNRLLQAQTTVRQLVRLAQADWAGRGPFIDPDCPEQSMLPPRVGSEYPAGAWLVERCKAVSGIDTESTERPKTMITGNDLIRMGFTPGPAMGKMISLATQMHDERKLTREEILAMIDQQVYDYKQEYNGESPSLGIVYEAMHAT